MDIDSEQVSFEAIVFDQRPFRGLLEENSGIHRLQIVARSPDGHAADRDIRRRHRDDIAGTAAVEHRTRPSRQYDAPIDPDRAFVVARREFDDVAVLRPVQHRLQRLFRSSLQRLRTGEARNSGGEDRRRKDAQEKRHVSFPSQAVASGSTNMRPFISMCMA